ncbi:uL14 family ribosomal protein [Candidatus Woesearchaeota archaeon]|nr:uL14 family ribosomal protein [Candidatus Woesearchaeota archaeon]
MKAVKASIVRALPHTANVTICDNSGGRILRIISTFGHKTVKGRVSSAAIGDLVTGSVVEGKQDIRKTVVQAVIVRQKKAYMRLDGTHIKFEDNAVALIKDDLGNPKGTMIKGPMAKEAADRWPALSKIASMII